MMGGYALAEGGFRESWIASIVLFLIVAVPVAMGLHGGFVMDYSYYDSSRANSDPNHLTINSFASPALVASFALAPGRFRYIVFVLGVVASFAMGGRADFGLFIFTAIIFWWTTSNSVSKLKYISMGLMALLGLVFAMPSSFMSTSGVSRMLFAGGLSGDTSYVARVSFLYEDAPRLPSEAFFGNVSDLVKYHGSIGAYIHNILSVWQYYGVVVFLFVFCLLISHAVYVWRLRKSFMTATDKLGATILCYTFTGVLLAKAVPFPMMWIALGFWAAKRGDTKTFAYEAQ
jgi:hypothetical protein